MSEINLLTGEQKLINILANMARLHSERHVLQWDQRGDGLYETPVVFNKVIESPELPDEQSSTSLKLLDAVPHLFIILLVNLAQQNHLLLNKMFS